jgi:hypothetical protein
MIGYAYAAWTDLVTIKGTVAMGSLTLAWDEFEPPVCTEFHLPPSGPPLVPGEWEGKDIAYCYAELDLDSYVYDEHSEKGGYKNFFIYVENAYPQLYVHTTYILHNIGTIPVMVYGLEITGVKVDHTGAVICDVIYDPNFMGVFEDYNGNGVKDPEENVVINMEWVNGVFPYQLEPCNTNKGEFDMDFKQEAQECHTYILNVRVLGVQWNKLYEVMGP